MEAGAFGNVTSLKWIVLDFNALDSVESLVGVLEIEASEFGSFSCHLINAWSDSLF